MKDATFLVIMIWAVCAILWFVNVVKLVNCDFKEPYKEEVIRAIGVPVVFIGIIAGPMRFED